MTRSGENPVRRSGDLARYGTVRVITPVFVPDSSEYFADGLRILGKLFDSLEESIDERVRLTVVDNGSRPEVTNFLRERLDRGTIDRLVHNHENRGKVDAVLAELRATYEPVSVVVDADVVFRQGWVDCVLASLAAFPECGMLTLSPTPGWHAASSVVSTAWLTGARIVATSIADEADMRRFAASIGRQQLEQPVRGGQLAVERGGAALIIGFGHFAFAVRREVVDDLPAHPSLSARAGIDAAFLEIPADRAGWWCLSMPRAAVHHIGNRLDNTDEATIREFRSTVLVDFSQAPSPPRRIWASRLLTPAARRALLRLVRHEASRPATRRILIPKKDWQLANGSVLRVLDHLEEATLPYQFYRTPTERASRWRH